MDPVVSVVVPVYNTADWLRPCVDSVLGQTLTDIEVLLVDDGSTDGSSALCDEYAQKDPRVRVIHRENGGVMAAVIDGIRAARAPYMGFMDGDDWADPGYYAQLYACAVDTGADLVVGQYVNDYPDGSVRPPKHVRSQTELWEGDQAGRRLAEQLLCCGWTGRRPLYASRCDKLHRRDLLVRNIPYFEPSLAMGEDFVALIAELTDCRKVVALAGGDRYHYRQRAGSVTHLYTEKRVFTVQAVAAALTRIGRDKGLDMAVVDANIGQLAYGRVLAIAAAEGLSPAQRLADARRILAMTPPGALAAYARARKNPAVYVFTALLRAGLAGPCIRLARLYASLKK